jgi:transposase-like protein
MVLRTTTAVVRIVSQRMRRIVWTQQPSRARQSGMLSRIVDADGQTHDDLLRSTRDATAARQCCRQVLGARHPVTPRGITVEQNAAYPLAVRDVQHEGSLPERCQRR